eukprot:15485495-Alexandrium_andersonii.AAC.1
MAEPAQLRADLVAHGRQERRCDRLGHLTSMSPGRHCRHDRRTRIARPRPNFRVPKPRFLPPR